MTGWGEKEILNNGPIETDKALGLLAFRSEKALKVVQPPLELKKLNSIYLVTAAPAFSVFGRVSV